MPNSCLFPPAEVKGRLDDAASVHVYSVSTALPVEDAALWGEDFLGAESLYNQPQDADNCQRDNRCPPHVTCPHAHMLTCSHAHMLRYNFPPSHVSHSGGLQGYLVCRMGNRVSEKWQCMHRPPSHLSLPLPSSPSLAPSRFSAVCNPNVVRNPSGRGKKVLKSPVSASLPPQKAASNAPKSHTPATPPAPHTVAGKEERGRERKGEVSWRATFQTHCRSFDIPDTRAALRDT